MKCEQIQPNLLDYSRGALSGPEANEIRTHIGKCAECAALLAEEKAFACKLGEMPTVEPTHDVWTLVRAQTKPRRLPVLGWLTAMPTHARRAVATLSVAAVFVVGLISYNMKPEPQQPIIKNQPTTAIAVNWTDDPLGDRTDAMVDSIDDL